MGGTEHRQHDEWPDLDKPGGGDAGSQDPGNGGTRKGEITQELQEFGQQLVATARAAWQSDQRQELQREITDGLRLMRDQLGDAVEGMRTNPRAQDMAGSVKEQVNKAADSARVNDLIEEIRSGLSTGLREVNDQLRRFTERLERREGAATATEATRAAAESAGAAEASAEVNELLAIDAPGTTAEGQARHDLPGAPEGGTPPSDATDSPTGGA